MQELLEYIVKNIVGSDVEFQVAESETEEGVELVVNLPEEYCGKLIGKGGQTIKSIRDVISIMARRDNRRVFIKVRGSLE
jgi:predicted RNA-binding protein YlqC (UPF0109 family)